MSATAAPRETGPRPRPGPRLIGTPAHSNVTLAALRDGPPRTPEAMARLLCRIMWSEAHAARVYDTDADTRKEFLRVADVVLAWLAGAKGAQAAPPAPDQKPPHAAPSSGRARLIQTSALSPPPARALETPLPPLSIPTPAADRPERKVPPTLQAPAAERSPRRKKAPGTASTVQDRADDILRVGSAWSSGLPGTERLQMLRASRVFREIAGTSRAAFLA